MSNCRSCGEPIRWVRLTSGKRMPVDLEPSGKGNVVLHSSDRATVLSPKEVETAQDMLVPLYVSHFVTCPQAGSWRR